MPKSQKGQSSFINLREETIGYLASAAGEFGLSAHTIAAYRYDLEQAAIFFSRAGISSWAKVSSRDVVNFLGSSHKDLSGATLARRLASLRGFYRYWISEHEEQPKDPTRFPGKTRIWNRLPQILSPKEALGLMRVPQGGGWKALRDRAMLSLLYGAGLRASECCDLEMDNLALQSSGRSPGLLRVSGKGEKERLVPFGGKARSHLEEWIQNGRKQLTPRGTWVLLSKSGSRLDRTTVFRLVRDFAVRAGINRKVHPHILRHSCATHLLAGGGDLRSVQEFLGHSDLRTTERYTHVEIDELRSLHKLHHPRG